ncbi:MAG: GNAT family N-acetyltransferase [Spirochaetaceae bacterium]
MKSYETDRLILRMLKVEESKLLLDYMERNIGFLKKWEPLREKSYFSDNLVEETINNEISSNINKDSLNLYIFNKGEDSIIGKVSLTNIIYGVFQSCFLGYKLDECEINKGKITEALKKLIDIAFKEYKLHRIEANIIPDNVRSIKVIKKLNFTEEGLSKKYLKIDGKWEDHLHFAILNEDVE